MWENLKHLQAFELYYSLGKDRSLPAVAQQLAVSFTSVKKWSRLFGWQQRILARDHKNAVAIAKKTDDAIVKMRAEYREKIRESLSMVWAAIQTAKGQAERQIVDCRFWGREQP